MSKKSRRRNKKILAALALAGGAAMLAKGRGKGAGAVTGVPLNPNLQKTIAADAATDVAQDTAAADVVPARTSNAQTRFTTKGPDGTWRSPMAHKNYLASLPGAGVKAPPSILNPYNPYQNIKGRLGDRFKGGGIAKRGMGAAYKSGGRVKSMGIAKRGGGAAKR
tara:strand:- start:39 stop:533 length:495 start_codon:yes stop_codon:yes gene_type:complete